MLKEAHELLLDHLALLLDLRDDQQLRQSRGEDWQDCLELTNQLIDQLRRKLRQQIE